jgi:hypothetical protein
MKSLSAISLILVAVFLNSAVAGPKVPQVPIYDPPFSTMTFEEISAFSSSNSANSQQDPDQPSPAKKPGPVDQKGFYFSKVLRFISKLKASDKRPYAFESLKNIGQLQTMASDETTWNEFREAVYLACADKTPKIRRSNITICDNLEEDRVDALEMGSADRKPRP